MSSTRDWTQKKGYAGTVLLFSRIQFADEEDGLTEGTGDVVCGKRTEYIQMTFWIALLTKAYKKANPTAFPDPWRATLVCCGCNIRLYKEPSAGISPNPRHLAWRGMGSQSRKPKFVLCFLVQRTATWTAKTWISSLHFKENHSSCSPKALTSAFHFDLTCFLSTVSSDLDIRVQNYNTKLTI